MAENRTLVRPSRDPAIATFALLPSGSVRAPEMHMPLPVKLQDVIEAIEPLSEEWNAHINPGTGEIVCYTEEEATMAESDDDLPEWFVEHAPRVREARASKEFIELPGPFEFHEYAVMERFVNSLPSPVRDRVLAAMRGRRTFRGFKDAIFKEDVEDQWYRWRDQALEWGAGCGEQPRGARWCWSCAWLAVPARCGPDRWGMYRPGC